MTPKQIKNVKTWIAALRSGKYRQGQGALKQITESRNTRYCCLGVLAVTCGIGLVKNPDGTNWGTPANPESSEMNENFREVTGFPKKFHRKLIDLNDNEEYSLRKIADEIEKKLNQTLARIASK